MEAAITDRVKEMIGDAVERLSLGDEISWDASLSASPNGIVILIPLAMRSPLIGQEILNVAGLPVEQVIHPQQEAIDGMVSQMIEALREQRSEILSGEVSNNGGGEGLSLPGQDQPEVNP